VDVEVTVVGDVNPDLLYAVDHLPEQGKQVIARELHVKLGGSAANVAVALARLGVRTRFYGAVGNDVLGKFCRHELRAAGVDPVLTTVTAATGATSAMETPGERTMVSFRGANEFLDTTHVDPAGQWIHISGYWHLTTLRPKIGELLRISKEKGLITSVDMGSWSDDWSEAKYLRNAVLAGSVDFLLMDEQELARLMDKPTEEAIEIARAHACIGLHQGRNGATILCRGLEHHTPAWENIEVNVTTGAGDTWNAGFIWGYLRTNDVSRASDIGMAVVEFYVERGYPPTVHELKRFVREKMGSDAVEYLVPR